MGGAAANRPAGPGADWGSAVSSCRNGGRDVYQRPDSREYDQTEPIRGRVAFTDGTYWPFTCSRTTEDGTRELSHFELDDGTRYEPIRGVENG